MVVAHGQTRDAEGAMPAGFIRRVIIPEAREVSSLARQRLLAGFTDIEAEAERVEWQVWVEELASPRLEEKFDAWIGEIASEFANSHLVRLCVLRQTTLNLLAVQMFHLREQHEAAYREVARRAGVFPIEWGKPATCRAAKSAERSSTQARGLAWAPFP